MRIDIQSIHFTPDLSLLEFVNKKVGKLLSVDDNLRKADVFLKMERQESFDNKVAEIRVRSSNREYFAKKKCNSFEESTDLTVQAIRKQVLKSKGK